MQEQIRLRDESTAKLCQRVASSAGWPILISFAARVEPGGQTWKCLGQRNLSNRWRHEEISSSAGTRLAQASEAELKHLEVDF